MHRHSLADWPYTMAQTVWADGVATMNVIPHGSRLAMKKFLRLVASCAIVKMQMMGGGWEYECNEVFEFAVHFGGSQISDSSDRHAHTWRAVDYRKYGFTGISIDPITTYQKINGRLVWVPSEYHEVDRVQHCRRVFGSANFPLMSTYEATMAIITLADHDLLLPSPANGSLDMTFSSEGQVLRGGEGHQMNLVAATHFYMCLAVDVILSPLCHMVMGQFLLSHSRQLSTVFQILGAFGHYHQQGRTRWTMLQELRDAVRGGPYTLRLDLALTNSFMARMRGGGVVLYPHPTVMDFCVNNLKKPVTVNPFDLSPEAVEMLKMMWRKGTTLQKTYAAKAVLLYFEIKWLAGLSTAVAAKVLWSVLLT